MDRVGETARPSASSSGEVQEKKVENGAGSTRASSIGCQVVTDVISQTNPPEFPIYGKRNWGIGRNFMGITSVSLDRMENAFESHLFSKILIC